MRRALGLAILLASACATLGDEGPTDVNLPTSGVGPFRKLTGTELLDVAPFVLQGQAALYREPAALALDADPESTRVALYVVESQASGGDAIARTHADDARSFYGTAADVGHTPQVVLAADQAWEGASLSGPSALSTGGQVWLYYAGDGGIGLARSSDGLSFTKAPGPVLAPDPSVPWETTTPRAPSVAIYPDGTWRMLYAAGSSIGEAESSDGITWTRLDANPETSMADPVLGPSAPLAPEAVDAGALPPFDTAMVGDPCLAPRMTPGGRLQVRVLYTGYDAAPGTARHSGAIGFAARYGESGPLVRASAPVYSVSKQEAAPAFFEWSGGSMLYVQEDMPASGSTPVFLAIAGAVAPASMTLAVPTGFATSP